MNNPTNCADTNGQKVVGVGVQVEIQLGDVSIGVEFIWYFDPSVCGENDGLLVNYVYSGYEIPVQELNSLTNKVEALLLAYTTEQTEFSGDVFIGLVDTFLSGIGASGGAFWIDAKSDFKSPSDYSGSFETISFSVNVKGASVTGFHSYSDKCDVYGAKVGKKLPGVIKPPKLPIGMSYSRSDYSEPRILMAW